MNTKEVLIAARALIVKGWCRGVSAKNKSNKQVLAHDVTAAKFCSVGALWRVSDYGDGFQSAQKLLSSLTPQRSIVQFNDSKKNKRDVLRIFDKAIALQP